MIYLSPFVAPSFIYWSMDKEMRSLHEFLRQQEFSMRAVSFVFTVISRNLFHINANRQEKELH